MFKKREYRSQRVATRVAGSMKSMWNERKLEELGLLGLHIEIKKLNCFLREGEQIPIRKQAVWVEGWYQCANRWKGMGRNWAWTLKGKSWACERLFCSECWEQCCTCRASLLEGWACPCPTRLPWECSGEPSDRPRCMLWVNPQSHTAACSHHILVGWRLGTEEYKYENLWLEFKI